MRTFQGMIMLIYALLYRMHLGSLTDKSTIFIYFILFSQNFQYFTWSHFQQINDLLYLDLAY